MRIGKNLLSEASPSCAIVESVLTRTNLANGFVKIATPKNKADMIDTYQAKQDNYKNNMKTKDKRGRPPLSKMVRLELRRMRREGLRYREIALITGLSMGAIFKYTR